MRAFVTVGALALGLTFTWAGAASGAEPAFSATARERATIKTLLETNSVPLFVGGKALHETRGRYSVTWSSSCQSMVDLFIPAHRENGKLVNAEVVHETIDWMTHPDVVITGGNPAYVRVRGRYYYAGSAAQAAKLKTTTDRLWALCDDGNINVYLPEPKPRRAAAATDQPSSSIRDAFGDFNVRLPSNPPKKQGGSSSSLRDAFENFNVDVPLNLEKGVWVASDHTGTCLLGFMTAKGGGLSLGFDRAHKWTFMISDERANAIRRAGGIATLSIKGIGTSHRIQRNELPRSTREIYVLGLVGNEWEYFAQPMFDHEVFGVTLANRSGNKTVVYGLPAVPSAAARKFQDCALKS